MQAIRGASSANLLELAPERVAEWCEEDGRILVDRPVPDAPWRAPLAWLSYKVSTKRVRLDDVGSFVWRMLDGRHTVAEIAAALRAEFGERIEPAEERLGEMVRILHRGELIEYRRPENGAFTA